MNISEADYYKNGIEESVMVAEDKKSTCPERQETSQEFEARGGSIVACKPFKLYRGFNPCNGIETIVRLH